MESLYQLNFARIYTLGRIKQCKEDMWDIKPKGFSNTVRWNVGHIYVQMEILVQKAIPTYSIVHPEWIQFFAPGTDSDEWQEVSPSKEELIVSLKDQLDRILALLAPNIQDYLIETLEIGNLHSMETVEAIVQFIVWHEGVHAGVIHSINQANAV